MASSSQSKPRRQSAVTLLTADHKEVRKLFREFERLHKNDASPEEKRELVQEICTALTVHAQIEEEIFYPAAREALEDEQDMLDEATVEHASAKDLIAQLQSGDPEDELYDAKVKVLSEYVNHHVEEEEGEMFPQIKEADLDLMEIGERLARRKEELMAQSPNGAARSRTPAGSSARA